MEEILLNIPDRPPRRRSYLLRGWETRSQHPDRPSIWRFSLQDPQTGEQHHFPDLDSLLAFLRGTFGDSEQS